MQRERVVSYLQKYQYYPCIQENDDDEDDGPEMRKYVFMTTVAMPAFEQDGKSVSVEEFFKRQLFNSFNTVVRTHGSSWY